MVEVEDRQSPDKKHVATVCLISGESVQLVIIPAYNEEATVGAVVRAIRDMYPHMDVVVVNDRSADETARIAQDAGATVIHTRCRHGYGAAMMYGFSYARTQGYEVLATIDADGQHDPRALGPLFERAAQYDVVSGSRYHPDSPVGEGATPPDRYRINREFTELVNCITGWTLTDAFCGLKAYRVEPLARLNLTEAGYGFPLQFWMRAWREGLRVVEVPVEKIYLSVHRQFGNGLDNPDDRRRYYRAIIEREVAGSAQSPCLNAAV